MAATARQLVFGAGFACAGLLLLSSSASAEKGDAALVLPEAAVPVAAAGGEAGEWVAVPLPRPRPGSGGADVADVASPVVDDVAVALVPLPPERPASLRLAVMVEPAAGDADEPPSRPEVAQTALPGRQGIRSLVARHAEINGIPVALADAVVRVESRYDPRARNGANIGLTQISLPTARSLGYAGAAAGLVDANTNLTYGVRYLAQAYRLADGDTCRTILKFQGGHRAVAMTTAARSYCTQVQAHAALFR